MGQDSPGAASNAWGMGRIKQSATWWPVSRVALPVPEALAALRAIGYEGIDFAPRDRWQEIRDAGLTLSAISAHGTLADGLNRRQNHARIETEFRANAALAKEWGVPCLVCFPGNRGGLGDEEGAEITAEGLRRLAPIAEDAGVTLVMELLNSRVDHPDYQCDRTEWGVAVCERVGSPAVKLLYDIYHMQIMEGDLIRTIRTHHAHFGHYHTAGNPGRHELGTDQEIYYPAVCRAVAETGFSGFLAHEYGPTRDALEGLKEAFEACDV